MRNHALSVLEGLAEDNSDIILINGDLGFGVIDNFSRKYPERSFNAGISEQNMMGVAAGMALCGGIVYVYSIGNFPGMRCLEQIRNDVCYPNANVKIMAVGGGFSYGQLGMSHHATEDIAIMRALPGMHIFSPADPLDAEYAVKESLVTEGPCYIRLGKGREPMLPNPSVGPVRKIADGDRVAIFTTGPIVKEALEARAVLEDRKIHVAIYDIVQLKPTPVVLEDILQDYDVVVTLEEHNIIGGLGSIVSEELTKTSNGTVLRCIGLRDCFTSIVGDQNYLRRHYGMSSADVVKTIMDTLDELQVRDAGDGARQ